jgi:hypothetical protein
LTSGFSLVALLLVGLVRFQLFGQFEGFVVVGLWSPLRSLHVSLDWLSGCLMERD